MACAEGSTLPPPDPEPGNGGSGGAGGGMGIPPGQIGGTCVDDESCVVEGSTCVEVGAESYCTIACPPNCPTGTYCAIIEGKSMCVPDLQSQCRPCQSVLQCLNPSDVCLTAPGGDKFCARDCTTTGQCPNGFTCVVGANYPPKEAPDPPISDGGTDAGMGGGTDAGMGGGTDGGSDAGPPKPPEGQPYKFCVPNPPFSCPCTEVRDGVQKSCDKVNQYGECTGMETCNGDSKKFEGCTAKTPAPETCNAEDDNCNGTTDEGDANELCKDEGPVPPHAGYACTTDGTCGLGPCEAGWTNYPAGAVKDGCPCPTDPGEPNELCANATAVGMVSDAAGSTLSITGSLSADNDVDVWTFDTVDNDEVTTNSYHLKIDITAPMPNGEFVMDVIHGDACTDTPAGSATNITSYSWCVNGRGEDGLTGEIPCANDGSQPVHCNNNSSKYFVIVRRKPGVMGTCTPYALTIVGAGSDTCDFTQKCE